MAQVSTMVKLLASSRRVGARRHPENELLPRAEMMRLTGLGVIDCDPVSFKMELTTGGRFNSAEPLPTQDTDYGTMLIVFSDCNNAIVTFDFPGAGLSGSFPIKRVLEVNLALCEALPE